MGVYAWILKPRFVHPHRWENFIYVGSATRYGWGLYRRKLEHQGGWRGTNKFLKCRISEYGLSWKSPFVMLLSMQAASRENEDVVEARYLVTFAEAILTVWLGALTEGTSDNRRQSSRLRSLCPWDLDRIAHKGLCTHNPLTVDIKLPHGYRYSEQALIAGPTPNAENNNRGASIHNEDVDIQTRV